MPRAIGLIYVIKSNKKLILLLTARTNIAIVCTKAQVSGKDLVIVKNVFVKYLAKEPLDVAILLEITSDFAETLPKAVKNC